jgi:hypothetical protein
MRYRLSRSQNRVRVPALPLGPVSKPRQGPCVTACSGLETASGSCVTAWSGRETASGSCVTAWSGRDTASASCVTAWSGRDTASGSCVTAWSGGDTASGSCVTAGPDLETAAGPSVTAGPDLETAAGPSVTTGPDLATEAGPICYRLGRSRCRVGVMRRSVRASRMMRPDVVKRLLILMKLEPAGVAETHELFSDGARYCPTGWGPSKRLAALRDPAHSRRTK